MGPVNFYPYHQDYTTEDSTELSQSDDFMWTWKESLLVIPLGLIVTGTILGNLLVLYTAATRFHTLRLPTHYLIANLSLADFLVGVLVMPFLTVLQLTGKWYFGSVYCETWTLVHFWLCSASILSTCAVCIERYIGVRFPLKHKTIMNSKRIWALILCVWALGGLLAGSSLYVWPQPRSGLPYVCEINQQIGHVIVAVVGILYVPAVIMIILYLKIFVIATRHLKFVKNNSSIMAPSNSSISQQNGLASFFRKNSSACPNLTTIPEQEQDSSTSDVSISSSPRRSIEDLQIQQSPKDHFSITKKDSTMSAISSGTTSTSAPSTTSSSTSNIELVKNVQSRKQINLAKKLSLLVGILLASYLPFFTLYLVMAFHPGSIDLRVFNAFGWIRYFNSCINPIIYALAVPAYRKAMTKIIANALGKFKLIGVKEQT